MIHDNCSFYFKWKEYGILEISEENNNDSLSNYTSFISVPTRILDSGDLAFSATKIGKSNVSGLYILFCDYTIYT